MNPATAIPGKYKSLISLAVSAQIPCKFCIIADTEFAKLEGANDRELTEAVAMAGLTRHWSTVINGRQADRAAFKKDINRLVAGAKKHMATAGAGKPATAMTATR
jgi:AhpD family alkylhydroperoxidase